MSNYPPVAFLTMAYDPISTMRAIIGVGQQTYPGTKVIYLLYQKPFQLQNGHISSVDLRQFIVKGKWPALWYLKLTRFFDECTEDYFVWWDEDDRFENGYVEKALAPSLTGHSELAWNNDMIMVRGNSLKQGKYRSAIGTIAGRVDAAQNVAAMINPAGGNAKDCQYRKRLEKCLTIGKHDGWRYYIHHKNSHTTRFTKIGREQGEDIDA